MGKIIKDTEIMAMLVQLQQNQPNLPWGYEPVSPAIAYAEFLQDLGYLIARHFGGSFNGVSEPDGIEDLGYTLSFSWGWKVPENGGFYANLDTDISVDTWRKQSQKITEFGQLI